MRSNPALKGFFYPEVKIVKYEAANMMDMYRGRNVRRTNEWQTDRYGYRKKEPYRFPIEIALVGDSNMAGSGLTQTELFSEVLENAIKRGAYPLAPAGMESVFLMPLFKKNPPKIVVASFIERNLSTFHPYQIPFRRPGFAAWERMNTAVSEILLAQPFFRSLGIFVDRSFYKKTLAQYWKGRFFGGRPDLFISGINSELPMIFFQGSAANEPISEAELQSTVRTFKSYEEACRQAGIRFIFMPIPNKETIYYDILPGQLKSNRLQRLFTRLRAEGVEVVDLESAYLNFKEAQPEVLLYEPEDVHWNAQGVRLAVEILQKYLSQ